MRIDDDSNYWAMKYSISSILILTAVAAALSSALVSDSRLGVQFVFGFFYTFVLGAIVVACNAGESVRASSIGIAIFGVGYVLLSGMAGEMFKSSFFLDDLTWYFFPLETFLSSTYSYSVDCAKGIVGIVFSALGGLIGFAAYSFSMKDQLKNAADDRQS